ncbi:hypothetical protein ACIP17_07160 [Streptomyces iakyrus]|uniref:hypothetical protein n=1 Tax=Streptomyces iakyrus TaxID=68219 RepID=UPI003801074F
MPWLAGCRSLHRRCARKAGPSSPSRASPAPSSVIDGPPADVGLHTPQPVTALGSGRHRLVLPG